MQKKPSTHKERVEAATREAHLRVLIVALNEWASAPLQAKARAAVLLRMRKYQEAVTGGLFPPHSGVPAMSRHRGEMVNDEELAAVAEILKMNREGSRGRRMKRATPESLPWD